MQRVIILFVFCVISIPLLGQQNKLLRSDSLNFSVQVRYLLISYGAGVELPFRQNSFGLQVGYNHIPVNGSINIGFNTDRIISLEYKHYRKEAKPSSEQRYWGAYLLYQRRDHAYPHERDYEGDWTESSFIGIGPLVGYKWYIEEIFYLEGFCGLHVGSRWGETRTDERNPVSGGLDSSTQRRNDLSAGLRLGFSLGFHPF